MMKKLVFAILCLLLLAGCGQEKTYKIGVSQCSEDDWRRKLNDEIMREVLLHDNVRVEILSADDNSQKQKAQLHYFATNGFDVIIASPNEIDAVTPALDSIYSAGIPLIIFDRRTNNDHYTAFQGADNKAIGHAAAQYITTLTKEPRIIELEGSLETSPAIDRHEGFMSYVDSVQGMNVLVSAEAEWTFDGGKRVADSLIAVYPHANISYAHNDRMAMGAAEAREKAGRHDIKIVGIDATPEIGLKAVIDKEIDATFIYPSGGHQLIKTALAILAGRPYEKNLIMPSSTVVDATTAEIMLLQNTALKEEANNIHELKKHLNVYWQRHSAQTTLLYAAAVIVLLLAGLIFLMLRNFANQRKSRKEIEAQNKTLSLQRDEIKQQNEQLQQKNEEISDMMAHLQQATQSKLTFFTNVSHDLRTPLTLIAEPVAQLQKSENLTTTEQQMVNLASKNIKILMRLINQILDFRTYENAKMSLNLTEVNLAKAFGDWTEAFREVAAKPRLKFKVEQPRDPDNYGVAIDIDKMERVLFNLLANAFKFTPENGSVTVRLSKDTDNIYMTVADNGKGISDDDIKQIFERFFKADAISPQGSGIGLALTKAFGELHGGTISVESALGKGSTFTVQIPIRHIAETEATSHESKLKTNEISSELTKIGNEAEPPAESETTLLVIDDNADICALIKTLMCDRFTVLTASSGSDGIKLATKYVPDVIVCDVMMPGIDGIETCSRLKAEITTSHIPVLLLTACALDEQRIAGFDCGADGYLTKPFNSDVLVAQINSLIENRRRVQEAYQAQGGKLTAVQSAASAVLPSVRDIDSEFFQRFSDIVAKEMSNPDLNVDAIAATLGISRVQLYRKLKALTNYSPTDLLRNMRLQRASVLLKTSRASVADICYAVGFTAHSYFTKCYHDYFGESPTETQRRTSKLSE